MEGEVEADLVDEDPSSPVPQPDASPDTGGSGVDPFVALARASVEYFVTTERPLLMPEGLPPELVDARAGVFVSLHEHGDLRGCICLLYTAHERAFLDVTGALHLVDDADRVGAVFLCDLAQLVRCCIERGVPIGLNLFAIFILNERFRKAIGTMKNRIDRKTFKASARIVMLIRVVSRLLQQAHLAILDPCVDSTCARAVR